MKRVDANQAEIVKALRQAGCTVQSLAECGKGVPDLLAGIRDMNYLMECKDGAKPPSKRQLTPDEVRWHSDWNGQVSVVYCIEDALRVVGCFR